MAIRASELFSAILQLSQRSITQIRAVDATGQLNTINKGTAEQVDPTTDADLKSQQLIISNLLNYFPSLTVIGEESVATDPALIITDLNLALLPESLLPDDLRELNSEDLVVWVDPLDGTIEYVARNLDAVTSLIGVSWLGRPCFGAVGKVFGEPPTVFWGGPRIGLFRTIGENADTFEAFEAPPPPDRFIIGSTKSHEDPRLISFVNSLESDEILKCGGSGCKGLWLVQGKISAYVFPKDSAKKWDGCAVEALLEVCSGKYSKMTGELYNYQVEASHILYEGILATRNPELHSFIVQKYLELKARE
mmetsp:Transcript_3078/g.6369  ORF Transcript_3078/g.6369 Transcript_3078/m.6369 type:complete len:307 (+) Transcript_3078:1892-2812(+)